MLNLPLVSFDTPLVRKQDALGDNSQIRSLYSLSSFWEAEKFTELGRYFRFWDSRPKGLSGVPVASDIKSFQLAANVDSVSLCAISAVGDNPMNFEFRDHPANNLPGFGLELNGHRLAEFPEMSMHFCACAVEYMQVRQSLQPMYHEIKQTIHGRDRHYTRIIVPVESENGKVETLLYAVRRLQKNRVVMRVVK